MVLFFKQLDPRLGSRQLSLDARFFLKGPPRGFSLPPPSRITQ